MLKANDQSHRNSPIASTIALTAVSFAFVAGCASEKFSVRSEIPTSFTAQQKILAFGTNIVFKDGESSFASVEQRTLHLTPHFEYFDGNHVLQASASQKLLSFGVKIDIQDANGAAIGSVEENVWKSLFKVKTSYNVRDPNGSLLATSEKLDWTGTDLTIKRPDGTVVATMSRPWLDLGGATWKINIDRDPGFDKRLILFIPSFKTAADQARSK